jgi:glycosyltransferase involved in cell wall biosynthesis
LKTKDIVLLSTADWDNPFWTNKQHVAVQFAKLGHRTFYIDSLGLRRPSASAQDMGRIARRLRKAIRVPRQVRENLWVWSPLVLPFQHYALNRQINYHVLNCMLNFWLCSLGMKKELLWTYNPLTTDFLKVGSFDKLVYHCVDEVKAQPGMPETTIEKTEKDLVKRSNVVFVTSLKLLETRKKLNLNTHYFPNVADFDHFSKARDVGTSIPDDLENIPLPRVGFIGAISGYKIDFNLLRYVAEKRPMWSIVLIGKVGEGDPWTNLNIIDELPNIYLLGPRPYSDLPKYLKGFDVAILPNMTNEYTESMFPMKFFEYLAAGKSVVSVDLPALKDFHEVVCLSKTPEEFIKGIEESMRNDDSKLEMRLAVAEEHTYEKRTKKMLEMLQKI